MAVHVDGRTKLTYEDLVLFPDDGRRHEIMDGEHYVSPAPEIYHQELSKRIEFQLYGQIDQKGRGTVLDAPVDVQLSETDIVEPDIVVVLESRMAIVERKKIVGAPDLVIEILSESSEERDRTLKRDLYEQSGVREYWIVDPAERSVRQLVLTAGRYVDQGDSSTRVNSAALEGVSVDLTEVW